MSWNHKFRTIKETEDHLVYSKCIPYFHERTEAQKEQWLAQGYKTS